MRYGLNTKHLCRTLHTVVFDIDSSLAAVPIDFFSLCIKLARTRSTSSAVNGRSLDLCLHRHPVSVNCIYHARMVLSIDGSFAYFARNARCKATRVKLRPHRALRYVCYVCFARYVRYTKWPHWLRLVRDSREKLTDYFFYCHL